MQIDVSSSHGAIVTDDGQLYTFGEDVEGSLVLEKTTLKFSGVGLGPS